MSLWIWHFTGQSYSGDNILNRDNSNKIRFCPGSKSTRDKKVGPTGTTCVCQYYCSVSCRQARVDIECIWEPQRIGVQFWPCNVQAAPPWSSCLLDSWFLHVSNGNGSYTEGSTRRWKGCVHKVFTSDPQWMLHQCLDVLKMAALSILP